MPLQFEDLGPEVRLIKLSGRLDIAGVGETETRFAALAAASKHRLIVDLTDVNFLASIGIRMLITNAKAQQLKGGSTVLFVGDNATVAKTLELTGIDALVPMFTTMAQARAAASAA